MKKYISLYSTAFIFVLLFFVSLACFPSPAHADSGAVSFLNSFFPKTIATTSPALSESELANLTQPGIVRIVSHITGTLTIRSNFDIDLKDLKMTPLPVREKTIPVDEYLNGSGFIVTQDGYIITNSHVVSGNILLNTVISEIAKVVIEAKAKAMSAADHKIFEKNVSGLEGQAAAYQFGKDIVKAIQAIASPSLKVQVTVLNPSSATTTMQGLVNTGFSAKVISLNENYSNDQKDVAIIKINETNLPALPVALASSVDSITVGQKVHTFGFPSTADFNGDLGQSGFLIPTFSSGAITAFKDTKTSTFKVIQTDVKASSGSSGSPFLNNKGEVIGIITYVTNASSDSGVSGDGFSFAIPLSVIWPIINKASVVPSVGNLYSNFMNGVSSLTVSHCAEAINDFNAAKDVNKNFPVGKFIDSYVEQCRGIQSSGKSIDTDTDQLMVNLGSIKTPVIITLISLIVLIIIIIIFIWILRKLRKDEKVIGDMNQQKAINSGQFIPNTQNSPSVSVSQADLTAPAIASPAAPVATVLKVNHVEPEAQSAQPTSSSVAASPVMAPAAAPVVFPNVVKQTGIDDSSDRVNIANIYIKQQIRMGMAEGRIYLSLRAQGYSEAEIQQAFLKK